MKSSLIHSAVGFMIVGGILLAGCSPSSAQTQPSTSKAVAIIQQDNHVPDSSIDKSRWTIETSVGQVVADQPRTARIFELVGIDYCCGGKQMLGAAAKEKNVDPVQLLSALMAVGESLPAAETTNWQEVPLAELTRHIVETHHAWLRRELPPLLTTTKTVHRVHGQNHKELAEIESTLSAINLAVIPHLKEEETTLFPAIVALEKGTPTSDISAMLDSMRSDHDELGSKLHTLRELTDGFAVPVDACAKYREMLTGLEALERDMLQHVHLENNVLLPRARKLLGGD